MNIRKRKALKLRAAAANVAPVEDPEVAVEVAAPVVEKAEEPAVVEAPKPKRRKTTTTRKRKTPAE